jgi:hypothetical protein
MSRYLYRRIWEHSVSYDNETDNYQQDHITALE